MKWKLHRNPFLLGTGMTILVLALLAIFPKAFRAFDRSVLNVEYSIRGESKIDSSIVVLYFGNDDITSLGGLPLRRNYYALLIEALHELRARTVGIDIAFVEPDIHGDEYDDLLASVIKQSGNVVLGGYFHSISDGRTDTSYALGDDTIPERFTLETCGSFEMRTKLRTGRQPILPIPKLLDAAAGFGHTILSEEANIPIALRTSTGRFVPAFAYAILINACSSSNVDSFSRNENPAKTLPPIPGAPNGDVAINYTGGTGSLNILHAGEFLNAYAAWKTRGTPSLPIETMKGKIILVGIVAEGRSTFVNTPFELQFPSIGVHAMFLHNALHQNFLRIAPPWLEYAMVLVVGILSVAANIFMRELRALLATLLLLIALMAVSLILFSAKSYDLSVTAPCITVLLVFIGTTAYSHVAIRRDVRALLQEKETISTHLRDKERILSSLEERVSALQQETIESATLRDEIQKYEMEITQLRAQATDLHPFSTLEENQRQEFHGIVYSAAGPMPGIIDFIEKIADSDATVLVLGESGVGKELVARALHQRSRRRDKPFVAVNCGALTETLLESELFGHERGAFTGAIKEKPGRFELAADGTIFLDEIAETSEAFQIRLLRVLQDKTFERVGGTEIKRSSARVIAATNRDIKRAVDEKAFREDLFYRLNVLAVPLPPLRERQADIPLLIEYFMNKEQEGITCSANVMDVLRRYSWRGNVRELQSTIMRAVLLARAEGRTMIRVKDLPEEIASSVKPIRDFEEQIICSLREKQFSRSAISDTADELGGLNRGTVAEYFRGYCFKIFVESKLNINAAVERIAETPDTTVQERVAKKLIEYLRNAVEFIDASSPLEQVLTTSRPKFKNLPRRYHSYLEQIVTSSYHHEYSLDVQQTPSQG
ncbi:MAG: sigma 54-interacting transcriptional regulator [Ignavibacteriae bacterium]|nr:sigma 54-interacting transcriptional regulator [Ignavibacteriota bacterium]